MSSEKSIKMTRHQYRKLMELDATQNGASPGPISKSLTLSKASIQTVANSLAITLMVLSESETILRRANRIALADDLTTEAQTIKAVSALLVTDKFDNVTTETTNERHNTFGSKTKA